MTAIAACGGANPAEHTTDACDFPLVTSRQNMTGRGKKFMKFFSSECRNLSVSSTLKMSPVTRYVVGIFVDDVQAPKAGEGRRTP